MDSQTGQETIAEQQIACPGCKQDLNVSVSDEMEITVEISCGGCETEWEFGFKVTGVEYSGMQDAVSLEEMR